MKKIYARKEQQFSFLKVVCCFSPILIIGIFCGALIWHHWLMHAVTDFQRNGCPETPLPKAQVVAPSLK